MRTDWISLAGKVGLGSELDAWVLFGRVMSTEETAGYLPNDDGGVLGGGVEGRGAAW